MEKHRSLGEPARMILNKTNLSKYLWADALNNVYYVINRVLIIPILKIMPYEIFKNRVFIIPILKIMPFEIFKSSKPKIYHLYVFDCKCFILDSGDNNFGKFELKLMHVSFLDIQLLIKFFVFIINDPWS